MSNTSYAIARVGKRFKTSSQLVACDRHNERTRETPNADIARVSDNECFVGNNDEPLSELVYARIGDNGGKKIRTSKDPTQSAVLAFEVMLTASPQYFRPDNPSEPGVWQPARLRVWERASATWLKRWYGDNLIRATFHRDEATPHIHAIVVPMNAEGHLNARDYIGNRDKLSALQDDYAKAMQPLGLSRGIRGSKVQHEAISAFYKSVNQPWDETYTPEQIQDLAADRQRQVQRRDEMERTAFALSEENAQLKSANTLLQTQVQQLQQRVGRSDEFRQVSLVDVAVKLGLQPSEFDRSRWHGRNLHLKIDGTQFSIVGKDGTGYGAIDLVMRAKSCGFGESLVWMEQAFGNGVARALTMEQVAVACSVVEATKFVQPAPSKVHWRGVRKRLLKRTSLPSTVVDDLYQQGLLYADEENHAVFLERDLAGGIAGAIRCDTAGDYARVKNSDEAAAFYVVMPDNERMEQPERVVITDTPTEALAKLTLEHASPRTKYVSLGGSPAYLEHAKGFDQVEVSLGNEQAAQTVYKVIPDAVERKPKVSYQDQLKGELQQLTEGFKRGQAKSSQVQRREKPQDMER